MRSVIDDNVEAEKPAGYADDARVWVKGSVAIGFKPTCGKQKARGRRRKRKMQARRRRKCRMTKSE